jgi:hypothetical protein
MALLKLWEVSTYIPRLHSIGDKMENPILDIISFILGLYALTRISEWLEF